MPTRSRTCEVCERAATARVMEACAEIAPQFGLAPMRLLRMYLADFHREGHPRPSPLPRPMGRAS